MSTTDRHYDVLIAGAGITGSALLYVLSKFTDIRRIALLEKYCAAGEVNSSSLKNSQTLHFGDIETNYSLEKALVVKEAAEMTARYLERLPEPKGISTHSQSMVLAVGENEVERLAARHEQFRESYPALQKLERDDIAGFVGRNMSYDLPIIGRKMFLKTCSKIIPAIADNDLMPRKHRGGIRPQLVHKKTRQVLHGAGEIIGDNIIFNVTPSPGATASLQSAEKMTKQIQYFIGGLFECSILFIFYVFISIRKFHKFSCHCGVTMC